MAGFMAGFGPAAGQAMREGWDRNARREDDMFDKAFDLYTRNLDEKRKYDTDEKQRVDLASQISKFSGHGDDPLAASAAYDALKAGVDSSYLIKEFSKPGVKFGAADTSAETKSKGSALKEQQAKMTGDQSASSAASATPPDPRDAQQPQAPAQDEAGGGLFGKLFPRMKKFKSSAPDMSGAYNRVAQASGGSATPQDVQDTIGGKWRDVSQFKGPKATFTPAAADGADLNGLAMEDAIRLRDEALAKNLPEVAVKYDAVVKSYETAEAEREIAKDPSKATDLYAVPDENGDTHIVAGTKAHGVILGPDHKPLVGASMLPQDAKDRLKSLEGMRDDAQKFHAKIANTMSVYKTGAELVKAAQAHPEVLTPIGNLATVASGLGQDAQAAVLIINRAVSDPNDAEAKSKLNDAMKTLDESMSQYGIQEIAANKSLFDAKMLTMAYRAGSEEGVHGQGASDKDISRIRSIIDASDNNPVTFASNMAEYLGSLQRDEDDGKFLPYNQSIHDFSQYYGFKPYEPVQGLNDSLEASQDPDIKMMLGIMKNPQSQTGAEKKVETDKAEQDKANDPENPDNQEVMPVEDAIKILKENPTPEMRKFFNDAYKKQGYTAEKALGEAGTTGTGE